LLVVAQAASTSLSPITLLVAVLGQAVIARLLLAKILVVAGRRKPLSHLQALVPTRSLLAALAPIAYLGASRLLLVVTVEVVAVMRPMTVAATVVRRVVAVLERVEIAPLVHGAHQLRETTVVLVPTLVELRVVLVVVAQVLLVTVETLVVTRVVTVETVSHPLLLVQQ